MKKSNLAKYGFMALLLGSSIQVLFTLYEIQQIQLTNYDDYEKQISIAARVILSLGEFACAVLAAVLTYVERRAWARIATTTAIFCELFAIGAGIVGRMAINQNSHQKQQAIDIRAETLRGSSSAKLEAAKLNASAAKGYAACAGKKDGCSWGASKNASASMEAAAQAKQDGLAAAAAVESRGVTQIDMMEKVFPGSGEKASSIFDAIIIALLGLINICCLVVVRESVSSALVGSPPPAPKPSGAPSNQSGRVLVEDEPESHQPAPEVEPDQPPSPAGKTGATLVRRASDAGAKLDQRKLTKSQAIQAIKRGQQSPDLGKLRDAVKGGQPVAVEIRRELKEQGVLVAVDKRGKLGLAK